MKLFPPYVIIITIKYFTLIKMERTKKALSALSLGHLKASPDTDQLVPLDRDDGQWDRPMHAAPDTSWFI